MRTQTLLSLFPFALAACTHPVTVSSPVPERGKPTAPVAVSAELSAKSARVTVRFEAAAEAVTVTVAGNDGLVVSGPATPVTDASVAKDEVRSFDVAFEPGEGRSQLVVSVAGRFGGASRARVAAFEVGKGPWPESPGTLQETDDGERVRVMPAAPP